MELLRRFDTPTSLPVIFTQAGLNAELALDEVLPRMTLLIHLVLNEESLVDARESRALELTAVITDDLLPTAPLQQRQVIDSEDDSQVLPPGQRAGKDRSGESFQQQA